MPEQVMKYWDSIRSGLELSLPPIVGKKNIADDDVMNNICAAMLAGQMVCWLCYRKKEDGADVTGFVVTTILADQCTMTKSLLLYSVYSPDDREIGDDGWAEGFVALSKYGKSMGCSNMVGYTNIGTIIERVEEYGGTAYKFGVVPLG